MDTTLLKWGALPSPPDDRDYQFKDIIAGAGVLPSKYQNPYLEELNNLVLDQNVTDECVCCSVAHLQWLIEKKQNGNTKMFSPSYLYGNHSWDDVETGGCYPRCVCAQHVKFGICHFEDFPKWYTAKPVAKKEYKANKDELDKKAYPYRCNSYYSCGTNEDTIKRAIMLRGGVMINVPVQDTLLNMSDPITPAPKLSAIFGYHAMTVVGWDDSLGCWLVMNSYGKCYNDINLGANKKNGYFYLSYDYPIQETWTFVDDINEVQKEEADMFKDTIGHWAEESIDKAAQKGIVQGFEDGTFRPDEMVTRAQLCVILDRLGELD